MVGKLGAYLNMGTARDFPCKLVLGDDIYITNKTGQQTSAKGIATRKETLADCSAFIRHALAGK